MKMKRENILKYIYTTLVIVFPLPFLYSVGGSFLTVADIFLFLLWILMICDSFVNDNRISVTVEIVPYFCYVFFWAIFAVTLGLDNAILGSTLRYIFYLLTIFLWTHRYFCSSIGESVYLGISAASTFFLIIQTILYRFFHYYLPGHLEIPFFPVLSNQINSLESNLTQSWFTILRPASFFAEPAHYAEFVLGAIVIALFVRNKIKISLFFSFGILLSMASTGIILLPIIWAIYLLFRFRASFSLKKVLVLFSVLPFVVFAFVNTSFFEYFQLRMQTGKSSVGRFSGYSIVLDHFKDISIDSLLGYGMNASGFSVYLAGYPRLIYFFGIIGCVCFILFIVNSFLSKKLQGWQKILLCVFLGLNVGTELLFQPIVLVYLSFILFYINQDEKNVSLRYFKL